MTQHDNKSFKEASACHICGKILGSDKVRDHCHITGKYRGAAHKACNRPFSSVTSTTFVSLLRTWLLPSHWLATALLW